MFIIPQSRCLNDETGSPRAYMRWVTLKRRDGEAGYELTGSITPEQLIYRVGYKVTLNGVPIGFFATTKRADEVVAEIIAAAGTESPKFVVPKN